MSVINMILFVCGAVDCIKCGLIVYGLHVLAL